MTSQTLITAALRKLGMMKGGETPEVEDLTEGLSALQTMLRSWAAVHIAVFASVHESFTLTPSTATYTWGSGGTFNTLRPNQLISGYIKDTGGVSYPPLYLYDADEYRRISIKTTSGRPYGVWFDPQYTLAYITFYPVPDAADSFYAESLKPFPDASCTNTLTDTLVFPPEYEEPMIYNLAVRLAPEYGKTVPIEVASIAGSSFERLKILHAGNQVHHAIVIIPAGLAGGRYSINSDTVR